MHDDPARVGVTTRTTTLRDAPGGTEVELRMDGVRDGVPAAPDETGSGTASDALARLVG